MVVCISHFKGATIRSLGGGVSKISYIFYPARQCAEYFNACLYRTVIEINYLLHAVCPKLFIQKNPPAPLPSLGYAVLFRTIYANNDLFHIQLSRG